MDGTLQIIVGILAVFFLGVAIAKSLAQRARRREAAAKSLAASQAAQEVSLHNPFSADPEAPQADGGGTEAPAPTQDDGGGIASADEPQASGRGETEDAADENSKRTTASESGETESAYKWE